MKAESAKERQARLQKAAEKQRQRPDKGIDKWDEFKVGDMVVDEKGRVVALRRIRIVGGTPEFIVQLAPNEGVASVRAIRRRATREEVIEFGKAETGG